MKKISSLKNLFLVATNEMSDNIFSKSVIYIYEHNSKGAMGFVVNKLSDIEVEDILHSAEIKANDFKLANIPVLKGGPVSNKQVFVLHRSSDTEKETKTIKVDSAKEKLKKILQKASPDDIIFFMGYAGWEKGQLENEIYNNYWLVVPTSESLLFDVSLDKRWYAAGRLLGFDINHLSGYSGRA